MSVNSRSYRIIFLAGFSGVLWENTGRLFALKDISVDIYVAMVSSTHNVCAKDVYVAIVSTIVETDKPELEITPGLRLLGPIYDQ